VSKELRLIAWPFHNGQRDVSTGAGAARLAGDALLRGAIETAGWRACDDRVEPVPRPSLERLLACLRLAYERFTVAAAAITAFDPRLDTAGRTLAAARRIAATLAGAT